MLCLAGAVAAWGQVAVVTVTDTTGWNPWLTGGSAFMADPAADQQTGQGADDFVGSTTVPGFMQKAGLLGGVDSYVFRTRMNKYDSKGFGGNIILGGDLDGDGDVDFFMKMSDSAQGVTLSFALPGTGLNISPNTTSIITPWAAAATPISATAGTYNYQQVTTDPFSATPDAYVTFGVSFSNLQTGIRNLYAAATTNPGLIFKTQVIDYNTRISFIAATSTQGNALNQDLYGTAGNTNSTLTWSQLGASTGFALPSGIIPEPATYLQIGLLLVAGGGMAWRQRRRQARAVTV